MPHKENREVLSIIKCFKNFACGCIRAKTQKYFLSSFRDVTLPAAENICSDFYHLDSTWSLILYQYYSNCLLDICY